jgi:biopolymer transport protein ExbB/TolQ
MATHKVDFPVHKRPTTDVSVAKMFAIGLVITVIFYMALMPLAGNPGALGFIRDLYMGRAQIYFDRIFFCGLIKLMWALSMAGLVLKISRIRAERATIEENILPDNMDLNDPEMANEVYERVRSHPKLTESIGLTRFARVLAVWINTQDFDRTVNTSKEESELDAYASDSSYRLNRLFIWALPVLGFIGTVYGVSLAVSNFANFLSGAVTPEAIKTQVGLITTGLGVAFYTTLLGLIYATIAAFASLLMERSEEGMLEAVDELVQDRLVLRMPTPAEAAEKEQFPMEKMVAAIKEGMDGIQANLKFPVDELAQAIDAGFRRLPNPDRYEEVFTRAIGKAGDIISQKYEEFQTNYERRIGELGSQLGGKLEVVANNFNAGSQKMMSEFTKAQDKTLEQFAKNDQKLTEQFDELTDKVTSLGKEISDQIGDAHDRYLEAVAELDKKEIQRWEKMVADFNQLSVRIAESFKQSVGTLEAASSRYSERIQQAAESLVEQLDKVTQLGNEIDKVLRTTQSMEATLRQVGSSDEFRQTLANIRNHLATSDELLKQLSRPRKVIFQEARSDEGM